MEHYVADFGTFVLEFTTEHGHLLGHLFSPSYPKERLGTQAAACLRCFTSPSCLGPRFPPQKNNRTPPKKPPGLLKKQPKKETPRTVENRTVEKKDNNKRKKNTTTLKQNKTPEASEVGRHPSPSTTTASLSPGRPGAVGSAKWPPSSVGRPQPGGSLGRWDSNGGTAYSNSEAGISCCMLDIMQDVLESKLCIL